ncbi:helix-turn-helix domain-containing protein [Acinetobacter haemolyticus]|uniref:helix-turn-helix domain-containing protein n=1 Tax=Acinetobacter haemolyticus TaxID=29430 RepID=UPI0030098618
MSNDATRWAWTAPVQTSAQRLVLLSLADRAGEQHTAWPSMERLAADTVLNLKTVKKVVTDLIRLGLVLDTGKRTGPTGRVRILKLVGVQSRDHQQNDVNNPNIGSIKMPNKPKNGVIEQYQKRVDYTPPIDPILDSNEPKNGTLNEPNFGTQNLSLNLSLNLSEKHDWIPNQKQLESKIKIAGHEKNLDLIFGLPSFEFELSAFNSYFENSGLSDSKKLHKFTAWIVDKFERYKKKNPEYGIHSSLETGQQAITTRPFINLPTKPKSLLGDAQ